MTFSVTLKVVLVALATIVGSALFPVAASAADPPDTFYRCSNRGSFHNLPYCPATVAQITSHAIEPGRRVVVRRLVVGVIDDTSIRLIHPKLYGCGPDGCEFGVELFGDVVWPGRRIPDLGDVVDLYVVTMSDGSVTPVGYVRKGNCPVDDWEQCFGI